jgi:hypothetical protein
MAMFASTDDHKAGNEDVVAATSPWVTKKQPKKCRDPVFAVLLYANVAAIVGVYAKYGTNIIVDDSAAAQDDALVNTDFTPIIYTASALAGFSLVLSAIFMQILMMIPGILIKAALFFNIALCAVAAAVSSYRGWVGQHLYALNSNAFMPNFHIHCIT